MLCHDSMEVEMLTRRSTLMIAPYFFSCSCCNGAPAKDFEFFCADSSKPMAVGSQDLHKMDSIDWDHPAISVIPELVHRCTEIYGLKTEYFFTDAASLNQSQILRLIGTDETKIVFGLSDVVTTGIPLLFAVLLHEFAHLFQVSRLASWERWRDEVELMKVELHADLLAGAAFRRMYDAGIGYSGSVPTDCNRTGYNGFIRFGNSFENSDLSPDPANTKSRFERDLLVTSETQIIEPSPPSPENNSTTGSAPLAPIKPKLIELKLGSNRPTENLFIRNRDGSLTEYESLVSQGPVPLRSDGRPDAGELDSGCVEQGNIPFTFGMVQHGILSWRQLGDVESNNIAHGSPSQRANAFLTGYELAGDRFLAMKQIGDKGAAFLGVSL
jgi:hypothetical protein